MNVDILSFFGAHMDALPMYEKLEEQILSRIPDVKIKVSKTQITFANKRGFAFVSFNPCRKAAHRPKVWMTVTFGLGYRKESPRIDVATEPYPNRWTHHVIGWKCGGNRRRADGLGPGSSGFFCCQEVMLCGLRK